MLYFAVLKEVEIKTMDQTPDANLLQNVIGSYFGHAPPLQNISWRFLRNPANKQKTQTKHNLLYGGK